ncbi:MAG: carboxypeptidase-like regulatory domain-containing protein, partial [Ekhidna sp.]|nr:carboxypeptidase-like regulatory domain-containing protein [Ekhidna sp.]
MKAINIILILLVHWGYSQDINQTISLPEKSNTILSIIKEIQRQSDFDFTYNPKQVPIDKKIRLSNTSGSIESLLEETLKGTSITFSIIDKNIVLKKEKPVDDGPKSEENIESLQGRVVDKVTREPLPFSTIRIKGTSKGVVSNEDGKFDLKLDNNHNHQSVVISFLGYENKELAISSFGNERLEIALEESILNLSEVVITPKEPLEIIGEALSKIPENYRTDTYAYDAYYRELVKVDTSFVKFADAATYIHNAGYSKEFPKEPAPYILSESGMLPFFDDLAFSRVNKHIKIIESRASENHQKIKLKFFTDAFEQFGIVNGTLDLLRLDYVETKMEFLDPKKWKLYDYQMESNTTYNSRRAYVISFAPKSKGNKKAFVAGKLYIDMNSSAIIGYEYDVTEKFQNKLRKNLSLTIHVAPPKKLKEAVGKQRYIKRKIGDI